MSEDEALEETRPTGNGRARGLVSSRVSGRRTQARTYAPPTDLRDVVESYWIGEWDLRGQEPHVTELLGDPCVHFAFEHGDLRTECRLVGVWTRLWIRRLEERGRVVGVKLRPGAFRAFAGADAALYSDGEHMLDTLMPGATQVHVEIGESQEDAAAFGAVTSWLRACRRHDDDPQVALAIAIAQRIATDRTITSVDRLAEATHEHPRTLERVFRAHVGAAPKAVIRRYRLQEVAVRIERGDVPSLATLAYDLGYADQAHLSRDWKAMVGTTPSAFAAAQEQERAAQRSASSAELKPHS